MSAASLQRSAVISFLLHLTLFGAAIWSARHSNHFVMPSPYVVNLVAPSSMTGAQGGPAGRVGPVSPSEKPASEKPAAHNTRPESMAAPESPKTQRRNREEYLSERIAELEAKKKIERIVRLRDVVSLKVGKGEGRSGPAAGKVGGGSVPFTATGGQGRGSNVENYTARIGEEIRQHWAYPETGDKDMEAIISIRIQKNGSLQILGVEKSSGNPLFDRSALRAITKASPVTQPPQEMEIGVRFYP